MQHLDRAHFIRPWHECLQVTTQSRWREWLLPQNHFTSWSIEWDPFTFIDDQVSDSQHLLFQKTTYWISFQCSSCWPQKRPSLLQRLMYLLGIINLNISTTRDTALSPTTSYNRCMRSHASSCCQYPSSSMHSSDILGARLSPYL